MRNHLNKRKKQFANQKPPNQLYGVQTKSLMSLLSLMPLNEKIRNISSSYVKKKIYAQPCKLTFFAHPAFTVFGVNQDKL